MISYPIITINKKSNHNTFFKEKKEEEIPKKKTKRVKFSNDSTQKTTIPIKCDSDLANYIDIFKRTVANKSDKTKGILQNRNCNDSTDLTNAKLNTSYENSNEGKKIKNRKFFREVLKYIFK